MASFEDCLNALDDFYKVLTTHFNDAAAGLALEPVRGDKPEDGYGFLVALNRDLDGTEKELFPAIFNDIPVRSFVLSPGYRDRTKDFELE